MRSLTEKEFQEAEKAALPSGIHPDQCPTCGSKPEYNEDVGAYIRPASKFNYHGPQDCDCEGQIALRKHYLLANIPDQYQRLDWEWDFKGGDHVRDVIHDYLKNWQTNKFSGLGLEFRGKALGVGKTFAATHLGKELVKQGERVYFVEFRDLVAAFSTAEGRELERKLKETNVVILDEVKAGFTDRQHNLFAEQFEGLIRYRTNFNATTIITTNLTDNELQIFYPRTYSLLSAKQYRVDMNGSDFRMGRLEQENLELAMNGEIRPIT